MAKVFPFQPYRYTPAAGPVQDLLTQPYDKITPEMQCAYLARSPHNLIHIELGERRPTDTEADSVYTRAARFLEEGIASGILAREEKPALYPYSQEFTDPGSGERLTRRGFIGLGAVEEYSAGWVFRHEQTLTGPKKDRTELLRHTRAHTGQLFMLYDDRYGEVDRILDQAMRERPLFSLTDEYGVVHTVWRITNENQIGRIQHAMADKKLIIADGHHRYETALAFHRENHGLVDASRAMMTLVNLRAPGLVILATHRVVHSLEGFSPERFLARAAEQFRVTALASEAELSEKWREPHPGRVRVGAAMGSGTWLLEMDRPKETLDVSILHESVLGRILEMSEDDVRQQRYLRYVRGLEPAVGQARNGAAQLSLLLEPTPIEDMARIALAGGVLPQKSTDFYPKMLSGLTIYRIER